MKKYLVVVAAIAIVIAMVGGAWAAGSLTPNVAVSGTVATTCVAGGAGAALNFGNSLDAVTNAGGATANLTGYTLWCTAGDSVGFAVDNGLWNSGSRRLKGAVSGAFIPYTVAFTQPVLGLGKPGDMIPTLAMSATIAAGAFDLAPADTYGDTLVMTITY